MPRWRRMLNGAGAILLIVFAGLQIYRAVGQYLPWSQPLDAAGASRSGHPAPPIFADRAGAWAAHPSRPTPATSANRPLGTPAPIRSASNAYRFLDPGDAHRPTAAYDPCRPIHFVVNAAAAPADSGRLLTAAISSVSRATGLQFVDDGATSEVASDRRPAFQPGRYGDRWAPVLISWTDPEHAPELTGAVVGTGGSATVRLAGHAPVYVSGQISLDAPQIAQILGRPGGDDIVRGIIQHELGHVVGLDHVADPAQLMYAQTVPGITDFGAGDLTGLSILGQGRCAPEL